MMLRLTIVFLLAFPMAAQTPAEHLHALFASYYEDLIRYSPELATRLGRDEYNDRWRDLSKEGRAAWRKLQQDYVERLETIGSEDLNAQDAISRELLLGDLRQNLEGAALDDYLLGFNQLFSYHTNVLLTVDAMTLRTTADYEDLIARLRKVPEYVDGVIATIEEGIAAGIVQPAYIGEIIVEQIEAQAAPPADDAPLLQAVRSFPKTVPAAQRERLREQAEAAYREAFQPAWRRLRQFVSETYAPAGREETAVTSLPDGEELYAFLVRRYTTTSLTPDEIHAIGLREVARINAEMNAIAEEAGFANADAYETFLRETPEQRFKSKEEMLVYCRDIAKRIDPGLPALFQKLPRMPVGIRAIPEDREAASASNYSQPAADGSRAAWFNLKAYKPEEQVRFDKPALVLHETNPGHHLQIALQLEIEDLPEFRKIYRVTAYSEGWALYAELFGEELGVYEDLASRFGALESERFRAKRLVVDTGLHAQGWSRQRAIDYLGAEEYVSEVDRYIAWPAQALAYKLGQLQIVELRDQAAAALGERFDIREFHDVILRNGPLPLDLLRAQVEAWIAQQ